MTEVEKFVARMEEKGVVHMHVDWTGPATAEERAKALNDVDDWLAVPANNLSSRLRGRAFLMQDSVACLRQFDCKTMQYIEPTPAQLSKARDQTHFAELLIEAAEFIEATNAK